MKRYFIIFALLLFTGCNESFSVPPKRSDVKERPVVDVPLPLRQSNWTKGGPRNGSCCWATMISLLRWQGRDNTADWIRQNYGGGEYPARMAEQLDAAEVRYAYTVDSDISFLEWACQTGRGCGVTVMGGAHMVALVHLDSKWAAVLDNNDITKYIWVPRETLIAEWLASYGWAISPVYVPAAPLP